ncbi:type 2 isopentenyl-diphosphate Delta-isomerase [Tepidibacillus marianensis]|uniref:type 2 isopentenyl-diphosphate Delta-isomerase n=1 Tax=Tepidibacillus marianensis TaxID=3131995 RepID=UPI0030D38453
MTRASRKLEHIQYALSMKPNGSSGFQDVHFVHQALSNIAYNNTILSTTIGGLHLSSPIIMNAMTGGSTETQEINEKLATVANESGIAMAVGSQMSAIKMNEYVPSYKIVRKVNPKGIIFANLGSEATVEQAKSAINMIEANGIQIHLNVIQELTMPEGDRDFRNTLDRLQEIKESANIPVIIKEVGFGISMETAKLLKDAGLRILDVGGKGGTNFATIENNRRDHPLQFFNDWGIPTAVSILEAKSQTQIEVIASGGIQSGIDVAKAIGLGAQAVGMAGVFLKRILKNGVEDTINWIDQLHQELRFIMTSLDAIHLLELQNKSVVLLGDTKSWCELRGIPLTPLAQRMNKDSFIKKPM